uniref:Uncharacterized protein n=1 Tax=Cacopsylla melanoneura TaxID=428564 RepID=A0A8D9AH53_9HEMI
MIFTLEEDEETVVEPCWDCAVELAGTRCLVMSSCLSLSPLIGVLTSLTTFILLPGVVLEPSPGLTCLVNITGFISSFNPSWFAFISCWFNFWAGEGLTGFPCGLAGPEPGLL